jgi:hypothetical protein
VPNGLLATSCSLADQQRPMQAVQALFVAQPVPSDRPIAVGKPSKTRIYRAADDSMPRQFRPAPNIVRRLPTERSATWRCGDKLVGFIWIKQDSYQEDEADAITFCGLRISWRF